MKLNYTAFFILLLFSFVLLGWIILDTTSCNIKTFWCSLSGEKLIFLLYALFCSAFFSIESAITSETKKKALEIGYKSHKFTYVENGKKKFNFYYLLSGFAWGIFLAFLMFVRISHETSHKLIVFLITLIVGLSSGLLTANLYGRTMVGLRKKKENDIE